MAVKKTGPGGVATEPQATGFIVTGGTTTQKALTVDADATISALAPLSSPTLTDVPAAPTAAPGTSTTQIATTAFVGAAVGAITPGTLPYTEKTADFTAAINNAYGFNKAGSICAATLPDTAAVGSKCVFYGIASDLGKIVAGATQTIKCENIATKTAGYVAIIGQYDKIEVVCIVADTTWEAHPSGPVNVEIS